MINVNLLEALAFDVSNTAGQQHVIRNLSLDNVSPKNHVVCTYIMHVIKNCEQPEVQV